MKPLVRIFLAVWLAVFALQTTDLVAALAPDDCVEDGTGAGGDPCPDNCARCVCCARVPAFVPPTIGTPPTAARGDLANLPSIDAVASAEPRGIFHVPRTR